MSKYGAISSLFRGEVLITSTSSVSQRGAVYVMDAAAPTQTPILHWKGALHVAPHGLACVASSTHADHDGGSGGFCATIDQDKAVLNVFSYQKDQPIARIVLPQKMVCIALAPIGNFLAAGSEDGRLYLWDLGTGALLSCFEAHYRAIRSVEFSPDSAAIASGSDDGRVCVWSLAGLIGKSDLGHGRVPVAYATFSDHTLPITDLHWAAGGFPNSAAIWTASQDATVKLWNLTTRRLTSTFTFAHPIARLAIDPLERFFFASAQDGHDVYRVELYSQHPEAWHAKGGRGAEGASVTVDTNSAQHQIRLKEQVTALTLSLAGSHLAIGTQVGQVHLVDVATLQVARVLNVNGTAAASLNTPVTNLMCILRPPDLLTAAQLGKRSGKGNAADTDLCNSMYLPPLPIRPIASQLARTVRPTAEADTVPLRIGDRAGIALDAFATYLGSEPTASYDQSVLTPYYATEDTEPNSAQSSSQSATSAEVLRLQTELDRAKALNTEMWQHLVSAQVGAHR
ncbi:Pre-rRNA-processing protein ipi3 [Malassezia psittaci]|uniref:Pre-rRNA-processing protein IPI3 n=1 Tax=Malassezia psittaci TaxID=1821823 RepID=A0AAF0JG91_9BASI|nr:Pre-rRNA-processing protein ipi3 [Malassezia psittaci]